MVILAKNTIFLMAKVEINEKPTVYQYEQPVPAYPLAPDYLFWQFQQEIKIVHNVNKRVLSTIKQQLETIDEFSLPNLVGFIKAFCIFVTMQHSGEENYLFPLFADYGVDTNGFCQDHILVDEVLTRLEDCAVRVPGAESSIAHLKTLIEELESMLLPHMNVVEALVASENFGKLGISRLEVEYTRTQMALDAKTFDQNIMLPMVF
jgi:hypothetical protein